jgi:hypothetical protein
MPKVEDPVRISNYDVVAAPAWVTVRAAKQPSTSSSFSGFAPGRISSAALVVVRQVLPPSLLSTVFDVGRAFPSEVYSIGSSLGRRPSGKDLSILSTSASDSWKSPAPAFSAACSGVEAFGIAKSPGRRTRNRSAT